MFFAGSDASGGSKKILLLDTGCKHNIIRSLLKRNLSVEWVPWDYDFSKKKYDGLMLGNGPGNPDQLGMIIERVRECFKNKKPIFGICLGHQIIAKAAGAKTYKMTFGHRSYNQPCIEIKEKKQTNKCLITSQNHGFAVAEKTIPKLVKKLKQNYTRQNDVQKSIGFCTRFCDNLMFQTDPKNRFVNTLFQ